MHRQALRLKETVLGLLPGFNRTRASKSQLLVLRRDSHVSGHSPGVIPRLGIRALSVMRTFMYVTGTYVQSN